MPEAPFLDALEPALVEAHVDASLLPLSGSTSTSTTKSYGTPYIVAEPCGAKVYPGETGICGTSFLGTSSLHIENCTFQYQSVIFNGYPELVPPSKYVTLFGATFKVCGDNDHSGHWWGQDIPMQNEGTSAVTYGH
jgi:hypothetical protein